MLCLIQKDLENIIFKVKVNGKDIKGCPFKIDVDGPPKPSAKMSGVVSFSISVFAPTKKPTDIKVTFDSQKNKLLPVVLQDPFSKDRFNINLITKDDDKSEHSCVVKVDGNNIKGSPFTQTF